VLRPILTLKREPVTNMRRLFAVIRSRGTSWDSGRSLETQNGWNAHAQFMSALAAEGFVAIGGPLEGTADTLLIVSAANEDQIRQRLSADPWGEDMLRICRIAPWSLRLGERRLAVEEPD
jgi:hypothetical protein